MLQKILVAIDPSTTNQPVFDCALSLAKSFNATLGLLYVFSFNDFKVPPSLRFETLEQYPTMLDDPINCYIGHLQPKPFKGADNPEFNLLQSYTHQAIAQGIPAEFFLCVGAPGLAICDFAKVWQADLIVVGHRGHSGLTELLLGSVSNYVMHHASCSVHMVRPQNPANAREPDRVEVAEQQGL
ncbi:MAG: universal stress protein [Kovacikia sp.]